MKLYLSLALFLYSMTCGYCQDIFSVTIEKAVENQLHIYPHSTLKDIYKNFFQDKFGPGHLLPDTAIAGNYLRKELTTMTTDESPLLELTGYQGNFYRVNLSVIQSGYISYDKFFDCFIRSMEGLKQPEIPEWKKEWEQIETIISKKYNYLPDYEQDKKEIINNLDSGDYIGHHSRLFELNYKPHYRIIRRDIAEREIIPLLPPALAK